MKFIIAKFGGTSLGSIDLIKNAANIVKEIINNGNKVIVVTSAMSGHTNNLISLSKDISNVDTIEKKFDYDVILSTGETLAASLFSLALKEIGVNACSMQSWQIAIESNDIPNNALIKKVNNQKISELIDKSIIPVITGFQAVTQDNIITTIGRGGSDTTAAAISASMNADFCDIYTDVEGLYSADPRLTSSAQLIEKISYDEAIELSGSGAKVLHPRSIEICKKFDINIRIISSFTKTCGTIIMKEIDESKNISGINILRNIKIFEVKLDKCNINEFINLLKKYNINIHQILSISDEFVKISVLNEYNLSFEKIIDENNLECTIVDKLACVTIVGASIRHDISVLSNILDILKDLDVKLQGIVNTEIKISLYLHQEGSEKIVKELHNKLVRNV